MNGFAKFRVHLSEMEAVQEVSGEELESTTGVFGLRQIMAGLCNPPQEADHCPNCGWTIQQFELGGEIGCSLCYAVFAVPISQRLRPNDLVS